VCVHIHEAHCHVVTQLATRPAPGEFPLHPADVFLSDETVSYLLLQFLSCVEGLGKHEQARCQPVQSMDGCVFVCVCVGVGVGVCVGVGVGVCVGMCVPCVCV